MQVDNIIEQSVCSARSIDSATCFFEDTFQSSIEIWDSLLTHQAALFAPAEIGYFAVYPLGHVRK